MVISYGNLINWCLYGKNMGIIYYFMVFSKPKMFFFFNLGCTVCPGYAGPAGVLRPIYEVEGR